jgi:hypothetical protein
VIKPQNRQAGVSLLGLIIILALLGGAAVIVAKVLPSVAENRSIEKAISVAVVGATSPQDVRIKFDKNAEVGYIETITGKDLEVTKAPDGSYVATYSYEKKIPLGGPVSLLIDYAGSSKGS